jgi:hypothetical protein
LDKKLNISKKPGSFFVSPAECLTIFHLVAFSTILMSAKEGPPVAGRSAVSPLRMKK